MNILSVVGLGLTGALLGIIIRQYKPEFSIYGSLTVGIIILGALIGLISPVLDTITELTDAVNLNDIYGSVLLKALAICYITQLASDCCSDAGEKAIASKLEMAGKIAIVVISLPLFQSLVNVVTGLISF